MLSGSGNTLTAVCVTATLSPGNHTIVASYSGDAFNRSGNGTLAYQLVHANNAVSSQTALTSSSNPVTQGASLTFTATVSRKCANRHGRVLQWRECDCELRHRSAQRRCRHLRNEWMDAGYLCDYRGVFG